MIKLARIHTRPPNRFFRSMRRQLDRAHFRERPRIPRHRRPRPRHNHHICRKHTPLSYLSELTFPIRTIVLERSEGSHPSPQPRPVLLGTVNFRLLTVNCSSASPASPPYPRPASGPLQLKTPRG